MVRVSECKMFLRQEICFVGLKLIGYGLPLNLPYSRANFGWQAVGVPRAHVASQTVGAPRRTNSL